MNEVNELKKAVEDLTAEIKKLREHQQQQPPYYFYPIYYPTYVPPQPCQPYYITATPTTCGGTFYTTLTSPNPRG